MRTEVIKRRLLAKARGEDVVEHYIRMLNYKGEVLSQEVAEIDEDLDLVIISNKEELMKYETENLHRLPIDGRD